MKSALLLTVPIAASGARLRIGSAGGAITYGKLHCPCIGLDSVQGESIVWVNNRTEQLVYPADNGAHCEAWDDDRMANCKEGADPGKGNSWCGEQWCYVDPCQCVGVQSHRSVRMQGVSLHGTSMYYSYETCGGTDHWTQDHNPGACHTAKTEAQCFGKKDCVWYKEECTSWDTAGLCELKVDSADWGHHNCPCVLPSGQNGSYKFLLGEEVTTVNASFGSTCKTWDVDADPACKGSEPSPHCAAKWCYVDSQHCSVDFGPIKSGYFPMGHFSGHPIAYSYQTCGNEVPEVVTTSPKGDEDTTSTSFIITVAEHPDGKTRGEPVYNYSGYKKNWSHEYGGYVYGKNGSK